MTTHFQSGKIISLRKAIAVSPPTHSVGGFRLSIGGFFIMYQVVKRDGQIADFDISKISFAITKAFEAIGKQYHP